MLHSEKLKDMNWSRRRGHLPELRRLPKDDQPPRSMPLLTQPFKAGLTGWIVIFGGVVAELAGGAAVANQTSTAIAVLVLTSYKPGVMAPYRTRGGHGKPVPFG